MHFVGFVAHNVARDRLMLDFILRSFQRPQDFYSNQTFMVLVNKGEEAYTLFTFTSIVFIQRLLYSARKALGFVCFDINSLCLINCNTSKTISSCFLRDDDDNYKTITKTFTKGDSRSNKVGV